MSNVDALSKRYMSHNEIFADAFNFLIYGGEQVIKPEQLSPLDTTEIEIPYGSDGLGQTVQRFRDVIKSVTAMTDDRAAYLVLGIEAQTDIHYAMPVRNMLYDALEYSRQVKELAAKHRREGDRGTQAEFLSGIHRDDRLIPVVTLVVYFGSDQWDGPRSLRDMTEISDERLGKFVEDYRLHLIVPAELSEEDFEKLKSELSEVMKYIQYSTSKDKISALIENDESFTHISRDAAVLLNECTKSDLIIDESKEVIDMCQAIKDMRKESMEEGEAKGRAEGRAEGEAKGRAESLFIAIKAMMENFHATAEQAMDALRIPENERASYLQQLQA